MRKIKSNLALYSRGYTLEKHVGKLWLEACDNLGRLGRKRCSKYKGCIQITFVSS
jgi:hypothetical protein